MKTWENNMSQRQEKEIEFMKARERRVEDYEKRLQQLRVQDAEEYNTVKIKLETDVQVCNNFVKFFCYSLLDSLVLWVTTDC